jgi:photosystem II stability/assembly factor-like uncharacterized protein
MVYVGVSTISGIKNGYYFVSKVDNNSIKLSFSNFDNFNDNFIQFNDGSYTISVVKSGYEDKNSSNYVKKVKEQNLFKKIPLKRYSESISKIDSDTLSGPIGILNNGVQLYSPKVLNQSIYYGRIEDISIVSNGNNYDVINPPKIKISSISGSGAVSHVNVSGSIDEIKVVSPGIGFLEKPKITVTGGNGSNAILDSNFVKERVISEFNALSGVDTNLDSITFLNNHNFITGDELIYNNNSNVSVSPLQNNSKYFAGVVSPTTIKLYSNQLDSYSGINTVSISGIGTGYHNFKTVEFKNTINKIYVINGGDNYSNKFINILTPENDTYYDKFGFTGINTSDSVLICKNHTFKDGDLIYYSFSGTSIGGISTTNQYYVKNIDSNSFKLSDAGSITSTPDKSNFNSQKYVTLTSVGVGTHKFSYPPIKISFESNIGFTSTSISYPELLPIVLGSIESIQLENPGVGYGSPDIINFNNPPVVEIEKESSQAVLRPIVNNGSITEVQILNSGSGYLNDTYIEIIGSGKYAEVIPNIINGKIDSVKIINRGIGYDNKITFIIKRRGSDAKFFSNLTEWRINQVNKLNSVINTDNNKGLLLPSQNEDFGLEYAAFFPKVSVQETPISHSPILGWAYDGNPIYGPYGYENLDGSGNIIKLKSGYKIKDILSNSLRPDKSNGFFIDDYEYSIDSDSDLDEYNGRFCVTPEYPNGIYAYFCNLDENDNNSFPYVIGNYFKNNRIKENYLKSFNQKDLDISSLNLIRNTNPYFKKDSSYSYLQDIDSKYNQEYIIKKILPSSIDSVLIYEPGENYQVNDRIITNNTGTEGKGFDSFVSRISGKPLESFSVGINTINSISFYNIGQTFVGISTIPHGLLSSEIIEIEDLSSTEFNFIKGKKLISVSQRETNVVEDIQPQSTTGEITNIKVNDISGFDIDDYIKINNETVQIIGINQTLNELIIRRNQSFLGIHTSPTVASLLPKKFTFIEESIPNITSIFNNQKVYFNATNSIGIGTTGTYNYKNVGIKTVYGGLVSSNQSVVAINTSLLSVGDYISGTHISAGTAVTSIGIGSIGISPAHTYSGVGIATVLIDVQRSVYDYFIPEKSIYLPKHNFYTGQELLYKKGSTGIGLSVSNNPNDVAFELNNQIVYAVNYGENFLGISTIGFTSTSGIGTNYNSLYFKTPPNNIGKDHSLTTNYPIITANANSYTSTIQTKENHGLLTNDLIRFEYTPSFIEEIIFRYDSYNKKITSGLFNFSPLTVNTSNNKITIGNNSFNTGDKIVYYTNGGDVIGGLSDKKTYFIIKESKDSIRLSNYKSDALVGIGISLTSTGTGTHSFAKINPQIKVTKGNIIKFTLENISNMKLVLYKDSEFLYKINEINYILPNGSYQLQTNNKDIPKEFYYNLIPLNGSEISQDKEVYNANKIVSQVNVYTIKDYSVIKITDKSFKINLPQTPEILSISNLNEIIYSTNSKSAYGPIFDLTVTFGGKGYKKLPKITRVESILGSNSILKPSSNNIGKIELLELTKNSFDYPTDNTLLPKLSVPAICEISKISRIGSIDIINFGRNYNAKPTLKVVGRDDIMLSANIQGGSVVSVDVIQNANDLFVPLDIISTRNSNGYDIDEIVVGSGGTSVTLELINSDIQRYPLINSGYGSTITNFPFSVGDEIFIERCNIEETNKSNFNSVDYNYKFFTVIGINTGNSTVTYSTDNVSNNFGTYQNDFGYGYVVNKKDMASFKMNLSDDLSYLSGEKVLSTNFKATVMENGWDNELNELRLIDCVGSLKVGDKLYGEKSKLNGEIKNINQFSLRSSLGVLRNKITYKQINNSLTNDYLIRIEDNDYYQKFAYSIKSEVPYDDWKEPVRSLNHPSGFKEFSDYNLVSKPTNGKSKTLKISPIDLKVDLSVNIDNYESLYSKSNVCLVTEDNIFEDGSIENVLIGSESANVSGIGITQAKGLFLSPYILNKTNKVLSIDDISDQFTGIVTTSGGKIVGISSFKLKNNDTPIFYKEFAANNSNIVKLDSNSFFLQNHNFQTGQKLKYTSPVGNEIGIKTTNLVESSIININQNGNVSVSSTDSSIIMQIGSGIGSAVYENGYNIGITTTIIGISSNAPSGVTYSIFGSADPFIPSTAITGIGTGARFTVLITYNGSGSPLSTSIVLRDGGSGYAVGDTVSIAGTYFYGATPTNDLSFVVSKVSSTKVISAANATFSNVSSTSITGIGSSAIFNVKRGADGSITSTEIVDGGVGYALTDKIKIVGNLIGGATPQDDYVFSPTILGTNKLPKTVYVSKLNDAQFKVSGISSLIADSELDIVNLGIGTHSFEYVGSNESSLILIDNIIQSPIYRRNIYTTLANSVSIGSTVIYVSSGINSITKIDKLKINDEILNIISVGIGSTNSIEVERAFFGSEEKNHNIGDTVSVIRGDYNIQKDVIYFSTPPYGPTGPEGFKINSTFQGRVFSRSFDDLTQPNDKNIILDDISVDFTGIAATNFILKSNNSTVVGIFTNTNGSGTDINNNPFILINNISQVSRDDFIIDTPNQNTIKFIGGAPSAGKIIKLGLSSSFGYQPLIGAAATVSVSAAGTISNVYLNGYGSGYRTAPIVSISSTVGSGAIITSSIGAGGTITGLSITNAGSGYTTAGITEVMIPIPSNYSDIPLSYASGNTGLGTNAKVSVQVGSGSSIIQFNIEEPGIGYKVGDVLVAPGITTNPNSASFTELKFTVEEVFTDKFSGFYPGQFIQFEDISKFFNGKKRKFTLYYKVNNVPEIITLKSQDGTDFDLNKNMFVFVNDILQEPIKSYVFTGNRIIFKEAPKQNSKCNILFYRGSSLDVSEVDPPKTIKSGDEIQILENAFVSDDISQFERVVKKINSTDDFDTFTYDSLGINPDPTAARPLKWTKQTKDRIINGVLYSKERPSLKSNIYPSTNVIKPVSKTDSEIYVENAFPLFSGVDLLTEDSRDVSIVENRSISPGILTAVVSASSTISSISIIDSGNGYLTNISPNVLVSSSALQIRDPFKNFNTSVGVSSIVNFKSIIINNNNHYIAVGSTNFVGLSTNGTQWFSYEIISGQNITYNSIAFTENNRYVSVGSSGKIYSSVGIGTTFNSWEEVKKFKLSGSIGVGNETYNEFNEYSEEFKSVSYSENLDLWVVVGSSKTTFYGVGAGTTTFFERTFSSQNLNSVANNNTVFSVVGVNGYIGVSTDAYDWSQVNQGLTNNSLNFVVWDSDRFIACGNNSTIITSQNGNSWSLINEVSPSSIDFVKIKPHSEGLYVALDINNDLYYSFNLKEWHLKKTGNFNDIIFNNSIGEYGRTVIVGSAGTSLYSDPVYNRASGIGSVTSGIITSIQITNEGFGYFESNLPSVIVESDTSKTETIYSVKVKGDYGTIIGINTFPQGTPGIGTTSPKVEFVLKSNYYDNLNLGIGYSSINTFADENNNPITYSQLSSGDYFVISNSSAKVKTGYNLVGITTLNGFDEIVGIVTSFIDGVYRVELVSPPSSGIVTVTCHFQPVQLSPGAGEAPIEVGLVTSKYYGNYSWSKIYDYQNRQRLSPFSFAVNTLNGITGIESGPQLYRTKSLK